MSVQPGERAEMPAKTERPANIFETRSVEKKSPFDIEKLSDKYKYRNTDWTIPQAFLFILISAAMSDGQFAGEEEDAIKTAAGRSRTLRALSPQDLAAANDVVLDRL